MKRIMNYTVFIIAFYLISFSGYSQGWIISEANNNVTIVSDGWVKTFPDEMDEVPVTTIYNAGENVIIMINDNDMIYAKGSGDDFCNAMRSMREEMNSQMPQEQQQMMKDMIAQEKAKPAPKVSVQKSQGETVAGYSTSKYSIIVNGELLEEKWISNDAFFRDLIQITNNFSDWSLKTAECTVPDEVFLRNAPEFTKEYMDVERTGIELRSIRYEYGSADTETDVVSIEKEDIPSEEFEIPEDYSEVSLKELIMSMSGM